MMAAPPLLAGGLNWKLAEPFPGVATRFVGASGTVAGVTLLEAAEGALLPAAFVATTVQVTATPLLRLPTTIGEAGPPVL